MKEEKWFCDKCGKETEVIGFELEQRNSVRIVRFLIEEGLSDYSIPVDTGITWALGEFCEKCLKEILGDLEQFCERHKIMKCLIKGVKEVKDG